MLTATLYTHMAGGASVHLAANDSHIATYPVAVDDGPGPVPAAEAVLARNGWRVVSAWIHESSGISGNVWTASVGQEASA